MVARADRRLAQADLPRDEAYQVSHETIYRSLFIQARGALKKELMAAPAAHARRCAARGITRRRPDSRRITDAVSISERPAVGRGSRRAGSLGRRSALRSKNSQIATLVERQSRYVMLAKVARQGHRNGGQRADQARPASCPTNSTGR